MIVGIEVQLEDNICIYMAECFVWRHPNLIREKDINNDN